MMKIQKHLKSQKVGVLLTNVSPLRVFREDKIRITLKVLANVCIVLYHHNLALDPVKETILISDNGFCHVPSHESAPT